VLEQGSLGGAVRRRTVRVRAVLFGTGTTRTAAVFPDNFAAAGTGMNQVRFFNAQSAAGDVFVTTPTGTITGTPSASITAGGVSTGGSVGFLSFPMANTRVRVFNTGVTRRGRNPSWRHGVRGRAVSLKYADSGA
jgi:hypothetical protein